MGQRFYSIGKAAVISLTKSVAIEWAGSGTPEDIALRRGVSGFRREPSYHWRESCRRYRDYARQEHEIAGERGALMQEAISGA